MFNAIEISEFEKRTGLVSAGLNLSWDGAKKIVSLRDIVSVLSIQIMPVNYLERLVFSTTLEGQDTIRPYQDCTIQRARVDPYNLLVGQTFVERPKYQRLIESLNQAFQGFCINHGFAKCISLIVLGKINDGSLALAHYLPPIVEEHSCGLHLLDGVHRNFLTKAIGTTIETIIIKGVKTPFPCEVGEWSRVKIVEQKPPRNERFINLKPILFRDLKWVGIDG